MLRESLKIDARATELWPHVSDLTRMVTWNPMLVSAVPDGAGGSARLGMTYRTVWELSRKHREFRTRVETFEPNHRVVFVHQDDKAPPTVVREHFELNEVGRSTAVIHLVDLSRVRIPWPFQLLIWFINRFGKPSEPTVLDHLRDAVATEPARR
jgi:uncharacterized protein YndB with AHSA1/START domain